jgi:hypothetical protein
MLYRIRRSDDEETTHDPDPDQYIQLLAEVTEALILEARLHQVELVGMAYDGMFVTVRPDGSSTVRFPAP